MKVDLHGEQRRVNLVERWEDVCDREMREEKRWRQVMERGEGRDGDK